MPKIVDKELKKMEILHAAMVTYGELGIKNTRIIDIARRAGIGKGTVYEYFKGQDEIVKEVFTLYIKEVSGESHNILTMNIDPVSKIKKIIDYSFGAIDHIGDELITLFMEIWMQAYKENNKELIDKINELYTMFRRQFAALIREGIRSGQFQKVDSLSVASAIIAIIDGLSIQKIIYGKAFNLKKTMNVSLDTILKGILK